MAEDKSSGEIRTNAFFTRLVHNLYSVSTSNPFKGLTKPLSHKKVQCVQMAGSFNPFKMSEEK